jgi:hypothetical protein
MSTTGDIDLWAKQFPTEAIPSILRLILSSWKTFKFTCKPFEVPITQRFCAHLRNNKNRSLHFFRIDWESYELDEEAQVTGRIDLKFSQGLDERIYFSIECKRLRIKRKEGIKSLAGDYVEKGMYRYFNGQYACDLDKGGMLGYVMDGNCNKAIKDVQKAIEKRRSSLYMQENEILKASSCIASKQVKETLHKYGPTKRFTIYHIFLPMNITPNTN